MKVAFVAPWYGEKIPGGAEMALREISRHLLQAGVDVEILTTCVKDFGTGSNWSDNYHKSGLSDSDGMPVRRFKVRKQNVGLFNAINAKLLHGVPLTLDEERQFMEESVNSPDLYQYIRENQKIYDIFVSIPYMFGTTYYSIQICPERCVMIPCFHDEPYIYLNCFKELYSKVGGMVFNAKPEQDLTDRVYDTSNVVEVVAGLGMDTDLHGDAERFRDKYQIYDPFILYAGRKDIGKNVPMLLNYHHEYLLRHPESKIKVVLIGGGRVKYPEEAENQIVDLGFVDTQDKYDACAAAEFLCQPSTHESFSYVIMESWLMERPVLVHRECEVTRYFTSDSNGGLYFHNYFEYEGCVDYFLTHPDVANQMGKQGKKYVLDHFTWDKVINNYMNLFFQVIEKYNDKEVD